MEYDEAIADISDEFKKGQRGWNRQTVTNLLDKTQKKRMKWIKEEKPLVCIILEKFAFLDLSKFVSKIPHAAQMYCSTCNLTQIVIYSNFLVVLIS